MFKSARWRSEKNKMKAVFKLQFHATQVSQLAVDALTISVIPAHVGKPTVRLGKANVRDGNCYWENPVYETVKFVREPKTGKIHQRIYYFVVGTGSSKTGVVGEVYMDLANYAEATKISSVSLPLKNVKSEAVLHVLLQKMDESVHQREVVETEAKLNFVYENFKPHINNSDTDGSTKTNSTEDFPFHKICSHVPELKGNHRASSESDVTMSSSGNSATIDAPTELRKVTADSNIFLSSLRNASDTPVPITDASGSISKEQHISEWEWLRDSVPEASRDESSVSLQGIHLRENSQEASDIVIEKRKTELTVLVRQAEISELEVQTLRKQIVKERKRGQDLSRELLSLKEEKDGLKDECEKLKAFQEHMDKVKSKNTSKFKRGDPWALVDELGQELNYEKDNNANLQIQLQKTQDSNSQLMHAVHDLNEILEQKNREILDLSKKSAVIEIVKEFHVTSSKHEIDDDEEQRALEVLVKKHCNAKEADTLEQKINDVYSEIEICKREKDELEVQMEQLALDYEILKQENHDISYKLEQCQLQEQLKMQYECSYSYASVNELEVQIAGLEDELNKQSKEFSKLLINMNGLVTQVKNLEEELENQAQGFEYELEALMHAKVQQEQKAIRAEETLRKTQLSNVKTAERLQEELKMLSVQLASTFDANEKLVTKAQFEAKELNQEKRKLEEMLQKYKKELLSVGEYYEEKLHQLSNQITSQINPTEQMQPETENEFIKLECQKKRFKEDRKLLSEEFLRMKDEIKRLTAEKSILSQQAEENVTLRAESEQMKQSLKEMKQLVQKGNTGRFELEKTLALAKVEADSMNEQNILKCLKHEKELVVRNLQLMSETFEVHGDELKDSLLENDLEKEKFEMKIVQFKTDPKEDTLNSSEKMLKECNGQTLISEGLRVSSLSIAHGSEKAVNLTEKIKFLEACEGTTDLTMNGRRNGEMRNTNKNSGIMVFMRNESDCIASLVIKRSKDNLAEEELHPSLLNTKNGRDIDGLLNEMTVLKERNNLMEGELKEMQERYSEISLKFAEVEGERQQLLMTLRSHNTRKNSKKS